MNSFDSERGSPRNSRAATLRLLLQRPGVTFLLEAHSALSAKIAEEAGFEAIWGSGLALSALSGVRDNNELSWTQVVDAVELITDATTIPLLLDADTGYGDFNTVRRLVRKLDSRGVAGICIEDKLFPKSNSLRLGSSQALADVEEFTAKIRAGKEASVSGELCIVARVEALIAGLGMDEAIRRAEAYHAAGADAILIHSRSPRPAEVLEFKSRFGDRCPVVIVPTTYAATPTAVFADAGFSAIIWANHMLRGSITAMQAIARTVKRDESVLGIEDRIASVAEVFRLQGADELEAAEKRYMPARAHAVTAVLLAASRGTELGVLTEDRPKALIAISGKPVLERIVEMLRSLGIARVTVVRGYKKELVNLPAVDVVDNDEYATTQEGHSLLLALRRVTGRLLVGFGDVICQPAIPAALLETDADFCIPVDPTPSTDRKRYTDYVLCAEPYSRERFDKPTTLVAIGATLGAERAVHGEWPGMLLLSETGAKRLRDFLEAASRRDGFARMRMADVLQGLMAQGAVISVVYTKAHWFDIDEMTDVVEASGFTGFPA